MPAPITTPVPSALQVSSLESPSSSRRRQRNKCRSVPLGRERLCDPVKCTADFPILFSSIHSFVFFTFWLQDRDLFSLAQCHSTASDFFFNLFYFLSLVVDMMRSRDRTRRSDNSDTLCGNPSNSLCAKPLSVFFFITIIWFYYKFHSDALG